MGYTTKYTLKTIPEEAYDSALNSIIETVGHNPFVDSCKWGDRRSDIEVASKDLPGIIIVVRGEGEDNSDEWIMYAHKGEVEFYKRSLWSPPPPSINMIKEAVTEGCAEVLKYYKM